MRVSKGKRIRTVILIIAFTLIIGVLLMGIRFATEVLRITANGGMQMGQAMQNLENIVGQLSDDEDVILSQRSAKIRINARALQERDFSGWNGEVCAFGDGYVAQVNGDFINLPTGTRIVAASEVKPEDFPYITAEELSSFRERGLYYDTADGIWCTLNSAPVRGNYVYVEFTPVSDQSGYTDRVLEVLNNVKALEKDYGVQIILIEKSTGGVVYWPEALTGYEQNPAALGIRMEEGQDSQDGALIQNQILLNNEIYNYVSKTIGGKYQVVVLSPTLQELKTVMPLVVAICGIIFVCFFVFSFWIYAVFKFVRTEKLSLHQQKNYFPNRVRSVSFGYAVISAIVVFLAALYGCVLIGLYQANANCNRVMETLFERIADSDGQLDSFKKTYDNNIIQELQVAAKLMEQYPELMQQDFIRDVNQIIGADYLVLFDADGQEYLTNSGLRGLHLGGPGDNNGAFLKLQNGIPSVINEPDQADASGIHMVSYGVPVSFSEDKNYGVLAAYLSPKVRESLKMFTHNELIDLLTSGTGMIFTADPDTKDVVYSSNPDIVGRNLVDLGMEEYQVKDHFMDFFRLNGESYYGISKARNELLYYVAMPQGYILFGSGAFAGMAVVSYFIFFLILMLSLLRNYKEENIEWQEWGEEYDDSAETVTLPSGKEKRTVDISQRWELLLRFRKRKSPGNSARLLAEILALVCICAGLVYVLLSGKEALSQSGIFGYVIYGEWTKGFNIFALTAILLLFCLVFFLNFVLELTGFLLNRFLNTKGETIGRLILNLTRYILIVIFFYYAAEDLGFDTRAVIASLGLVSFALSLGMKDLVTDLIAGITIVFEGEYQVGDIVEIDKYRGSVIEVGVRSTKLMGQGGNIKIINNRDVKNVINMTHLNSWCAVEFTVSREETMERMENMLEESLPEIKEKITEIISGPYYKGVTAFGRNGLTIVVTAECKERDYHRVQRALTGELNRLFEQNQVKF